MSPYDVNDLVMEGAPLTGNEELPLDSLPSPPLARIAKQPAPESVSSTGAVSDSEMDPASGWQTHQTMVNH